MTGLSIRLPIQNCASTSKLVFSTFSTVVISMENYFVCSNPSSSWNGRAEIAAVARTTRILKFIHT